MKAVTRKRYTAEFKAQAVGLVGLGKPVPEVADPKILGHFRNRFPQTHKPDGLGFELCGVSFSGHCFH